MVNIDLTGTAELNIIVNEGCSFELTFELCEDDAGLVPINWPTGNWKMQIKSSTGSLLMQVDSTNGFSVANNVFKILQTKSQNVLAKGKYAFLITCDLPNDLNIKPFTGIVSVINN
jgi:hypothetical protein